MAVLLLLIAFAVCWQVFARYVSSASSAWTSELASMAFVWLAMFAIALGVRRGRHMKLDIWEYLPYRRWLIRTIDTIAALGVAVVLVLLIWFGFEMLGPAFRRLQPGLGISFGWVSLAVPVGCLVSLIFAIEAWWKVFHAPRDTDVLAAPILFQKSEATQPATEGI
ncbi:TRAP transporter small permease [Mycetocola spongiae]|uniref:TRAP transporter small permease n=1 Tax=Mycetocola spongiae TaxID=2859226 RepID=UPI001CF46E01|nr:TRAP transporter small permease [Mycetocola spongiae]UCR88750.1 TRAP transporter small permease [Mycetocola spongiae]